MTSIVACPLTATDRCDRCAAQAFMRATMVSGAELLFCAHHGREYEGGLRGIDADIYWEPEQLAQVTVEAASEG